MSALTGCSCGHLQDDACIRHLPIGPPQCGCPLDHQQLEDCHARGIICGPGRCSLDDLTMARSMRPDRLSAVDLRSIATVESESKPGWGGADSSEFRDGGRSA